MSLSIKKDGNAAFIELRNSVFETYRSSVNAVRAGLPFLSYHIAGIINYYPGMLDETLWSHKSAEKLAQEYHEAISGECDGKINCILLLNGTPEEGILLHDAEEKLLCAYFPAITHEFIIQYDHAVRLLETVAQGSEGIRLYLPEDICRGRKSLNKLVKQITAQLL